MDKDKGCKQVIEATLPKKRSRNLLMDATCVYGCMATTRNYLMILLQYMEEENKITRDSEGLNILYNMNNSGNITPQIYNHNKKKSSYH